MQHEIADYQKDDTEQTGGRAENTTLPKFFSCDLKMEPVLDIQANDIQFKLIKC